MKTWSTARLPRQQVHAWYGLESETALTPNFFNGWNHCGHESSLNLTKASMSWKPAASPPLKRLRSAAGKNILFHHPPFGRPGDPSRRLGCNLPYPPRPPRPSREDLSPSSSICLRAIYTLFRYQLIANATYLHFVPVPAFGLRFRFPPSAFAPSATAEPIGNRSTGARCLNNA